MLLVEIRGGCAFVSSEDCEQYLFKDWDNDPNPKHRPELMDSEELECTRDDCFQDRDNCPDCCDGDKYRSPDCYYVEHY